MLVASVVGSETAVTVEVEGIPFLPEITVAKPLSLVGHGEFF